MNIEPGIILKNGESIAPTVYDLFEQQRIKLPDAIAVVHNNYSLTYHQLYQKANDLASVILTNYPDSEIIGVSAHRSIQTIIGVLAILKAGKGYLPLDPDYPKERLETIAKDSGIKACITTSDKKHLFEGLAIDILLADAAFEPNAESFPQSGFADIAYVLYTSGSTGTPKGVSMGNAALVNLLLWQQENSISAQEINTLQFAPLTFDVSFQEIFATLGTGGTLFLVDEELRIDPVKLLQFIDKHAINRIFLPFVVLQYLTEAAIANNYIPASLKEVMTAGEQLKITPQIVSFFNALPGCVLLNQYGPTETHVVTELRLDGDAALWPSLPSIGTAINNTEIILLDENFNRVADGETGELCVSGISLANGYLNKPELTTEKFIDWTEGDKTIRIYRTGDLARFMSDGNIEYLGRRDTQVKIRGNRVEIGEIEVLINQLDNIKQAVVTAPADAAGQKRLIAYLVSSGDKEDTEAVRKSLEEQLPDFMLPSAYVWLKELPKTTSGKVDRKALPKPDIKRPEMDVLYKAPSNPTEKNIAAILIELLQFDKVGVDDNFFQLGGNSLLALKTVALLKQRFNYEVPITKLYQYPTTAGIAKLINGVNKQVSPILAQKAKAADGNSDVAIIGMAGRFPGADTIDEFWQMLAEGREGTNFFTEEELDKYVPLYEKNNPAYVKARGILSGADQFDAGFFGFNPRAAELMDPQQRIFLELAWEVLEKTGHLPQKYDGLTGVFAGCGYNTYYNNNVLTNPEIVETVGHFQVRTLNEKDYIATRTAYQLNLKGPAVAVYSACSTSLLAITQAVSSIRNGQCQVAIAGAASITSPIKSGHIYEEGSIMSIDGHCRPFDAEASGTVFSDGAGVVLLKSVEDAQRDGDTIYAVIKGIGVNNDGAEKGSFGGPNAYGQAGAIAMAIADAGVDASTISYVEAHGTATPLGDPIEIEGLNLAFGQQDQKQFCAIGSVKSNFGHLTAASGVAGLIKTVLAMQYGQIPPSLFFKKINPNIDIENTPFFVNAELKPWDTELKRAGISSFGVGGTNVHVVLEEYKNAVPVDQSVDKPLKLISWSAKNEQSLDKYAGKLAAFVNANKSADLNDIAYTLQTTRADFNYRRFMIAADVDELVVKLNSANTDPASIKKLSTLASEVVFMFPGQGSQYVNMGHDLYQNESAFKEAVDECINLLQGTIHGGLLDIIFADTSDAQSAERIKNTLYTQPALFILEYAMARLWMSKGIQPAILMGHSIGEFVAAHLAGVFSLKDALTLIFERARLVSSAPHGQMLSVRIEEEQLKAILPASLSIAAVNSRKLCVVAGPEDAITSFTEELSQKGIPARLLLTSHAFHSLMMDDIVEPFKAVVKSVTLNKPLKPVVSTVTGTWLSEAQATDPEYWANHLRSTVRFADALNTVTEDDGRLLLECGPGNILATLARQHTTGKNISVISGFEQNDTLTEYHSLLKALGQLWLNGIEPNWEATYLGQNRKRIDIPTYAFDHKRYWLEPAVTINIVPETLTQQQTNTTTTQPALMRKDILIDKLKEIFEDAAGIEIDTAATGMTFIEIGFDSLSLTQIATNLKKVFNVPVTFRKLFEEYNSLELLAAYLDSNLPADAFQPQVAPAVNPAFQHGETNSTVQQTIQHHTQVIPSTFGNNGTSAYPATGQGNNDIAISLISQQLQLLASQLTLIQGNTPVVQAPAAQTYHAPAPAATPAKSLLSLAADFTPEEQVELKKPFGATARIEKQVQGLNDKQQAFLKDLTEKYNAKTKGSKAQTQKDRPYMADPRVVSGFRPLTKEIVYPLVVNRSKGSRVWDIDGNEYIDALNGFGSNFLGYQTDILKQAVLDQVEKGYEIGPQHELAGEVSKLICEFTNFDRAALCNTGSEAVLGAMRIARTVTGRSLIVAFNGSYHGINDEVIVRGTKKLKTVPAAPGIMPEVVQNMLILDYGTEESLKIIAERAHELAAVLVEPAQSRRPDFRPVEFLKRVREITRQSETVLIFDEVITGFRMHPGGAQAMFGIKADLGTYGKVIGGGMPIGAIAGISKYMDALDGGNWQFGDDSSPEAGVTYFAGTFVRHPLALATAKASLSYMKEKGPALQEGLNAMTKRLADALNAICEKEGLPLHIPSFGSLWKIKFDYELAYGELLFTLMRLKGIHIWDLFPCFITAAHTDEEVDQIINAFSESVNELIEIGIMPTHKPEAAKVEPVKNGLPAEPPVPGAKLGRDKDGNPGWFVTDANNPGKYLQVKISNK